MTTAVCVEDKKLDHSQYYAELTSRNVHFIPRATQRKLQDLTILIAGCGSTGGACIEALARVGVENFVLADNGAYDLSNMNRQHVRLDKIGTNKATFHRDEVLQINPFARCEVETDGVQLENVSRLCSGVDLVFDAVDVTTSSGMNSKIALHEEAHRRKLPVFSALDLGLRQWGHSFDYRDEELPVLNGRSDAAKRAKHPIAALFAIYPLDAVPDHCLQLFLDLLDGSSPFASQLGCTSDLLSGIIVPVVLRFLEKGEIVKGWEIDLSEIRYGDASHGFAKQSQGQALRAQLAECLAGDSDTFGRLFRGQKTF